MTDDDQEPYTLQYGALEGILKELLGATGGAVVSRFRKLRPKFAGDGLLTETGNRVSYDLTRILAICAIYELNALAMPQARAVDVVVASWPEIARASLVAWRPSAAPGAGRDAPQPIVRLYVDGLNEPPDGGSWASLAKASVAGIPHIVLDCGPAVTAIRAIAESAGRSGTLEAAFGELEATFGWERMREGDPLRLPRRRSSDFFGTGPYFERARALLAVDPDTKPDRRRAARLQATLDYLESPPPIDSWKRFIGTDERRPRLVHRLAAWGKALGLRSINTGPSDTLESAWLDREAAIDLIERGERRAAELASETVG